MYQRIQQRIYFLCLHRPYTVQVITIYVQQTNVQKHRNTAPAFRTLMSTFIRQWQKYIIQARLGLHTSKVKYNKTHKKVIKRNKNRQSIQLRF